LSLYKLSTADKNTKESFSRLAKTNSRLISANQSTPVLEAVAENGIK
jgi:hypothetical protein